MATISAVLSMSACSRTCDCKACAPFHQRSAWSFRASSMGNSTRPHMIKGLSRTGIRMRTCKRGSN
eukprot:6733682-Alexandrium_andersonii.AAC.1